MKSDVMRKLFGTVLLGAVLLTLSGCLLFASGKSFETIRFAHRDYISCGNTVLLDYRQPDTSSWEDMQNALLTKIGGTGSAAVYEITGYDSGSWIYCHVESMLGNGPEGVYHASDIKMDTVRDFKPDSLAVYALTKPTATGSGTESLYGSTSDQTVIDTILKAILDSKTLSPDVLQAAQKKAWSYDNAQQYRLEFESAVYPSLIYLYDYAIGTDGKNFVLSDMSGYELQSDILELVVPEMLQ